MNIYDLTFAFWFSLKCITKSLASTLLQWIQGLLFESIGLYFLFRRLAYANYRERQMGAARIRDDTGKIEKLFEKLSSDTGYPVI